MGLPGYLGMQKYYENEEIKNLGYSSRTIYTGPDFVIWEGRAAQTFADSYSFVTIRDERYDFEYYGETPLLSLIRAILGTKDDRLILKGLNALLIKAYLEYFLKHPEDFIKHMEILQGQHFEEGRRAKQVEFLSVLGIHEEE